MSDYHLQMEIIFQACELVDRAEAKSVSWDRLALAIAELRSRSDD